MSRMWTRTAVASVRLDEARQTTGDELLRAVTADPHASWSALTREDQP